ncbi:phosphoserine phosphatase SerB [Alteromonas sp. KS69]|uniref:phosphoserine phosphatase SerB n=1 Tax=uncultured Alteromonas sp. TaxID=179113 RepID=UPI000C47A502|nr:phosphoserine phosphatase SerB [Alteromonas sp. KS69]MBB67432.1 phosphoserine phosphatase SerB [Rickettsiales bacterium]RUP76745.1 phosphoserine phosphatase SerB [Alteromonas sp. KS69]
MITFLNEIPPHAMHDTSFLSTQLTTKSPSEDEAGLSILTVIGQALTPYIVSQVVEGFSDVFNATSIHLHPLHNKLGDGVVVVKGRLSENADSQAETAVPALVASLSARYHVDLGIQDVQPSLNEPGLLVMDMDSTLIDIECIDEIAKLAGVGEQVAAVTEQAMRGEIAFNDSLNHRVACLDGVPEQQLQQIRDSLPIMPGVQLLIAILKQHNWKLAIASGGFTYFANHLKARLDLDEAVSNTLVIEQGILTGEVSGEIVNAEVKARTVKALAERWGVPSAQTVAMGDGANDLVMMAESALGVACHGKPVVNEKADVAIRLGSLHCLLYFLS